MKAETPREIMRRADGLRERARALDHITLRMRLGDRTMQRGRHFFSRGKDLGDREVHLTAQEDQLFYEWAMTKMREYEREANELDAKLRVVDDSPAGPDN